MFRLLFHFVFVYVATWVIGGFTIWFFLTLVSGQSEIQKTDMYRVQTPTEKSTMPHVILKDHRFVPDR